MFTVAVYEGALQYGGAEEGGWWFWGGSLVPGTERWALTERGALRLMRRLRKAWPQGGDRSSVWPRERDFDVELFEGVSRAPGWVPEYRPHYE